MTTFRGHPQKGVLVRVKERVQSIWLHPDGTICQVSLFVAVAALSFAAYLFAMSGANLVAIPLETLILGLVIAWLERHVEWQRRQLDCACGALLDASVQKCRCESFPEGYEGCCHVCHARSVLKEHFPGELPYRIRADVLAGGTLTDELASNLTPADELLLNEELRMGWKVPFFPK
jgi:hypothetical protein